MGIVPLQYREGETADNLGLTGHEKFSMIFPENSSDLKPRQPITIKIEGTGKTFEAIMRFDTELELTYFKHGGILNYMIRKVAAH